MYICVVNDTHIISSDDEKQLVRLLKKGSDRAFRVVYNYYWPIMYSHALRMLQHEVDAEDITQELFVSFYGQLARLNDECSIGGWLFVTLRNKIINHIRNLRNQRRHIENWTTQERRFERRGTSPLEDLQLKELEALFDREVQQMPERMRKIFEMSRKEYLSHKEIAVRLKISDKTVKTQVNNALRILRSRLDSLTMLFL